MQGINEPSTTRVGQAVDDTRQSVGETKEGAGNLMSAAKDAGGQVGPWYTLYY